MASRSLSAAPPAVLLGGGVVAVAVARSLGKAGIPVFAAGESEYDTVRYSRYCTRFVDLGKGEGVQDRWFEWLRTLPHGAVVLPCHDEGIELVARRRPELVDLGLVLPETNDEIVLAMLDKARTYALAESAGVPVPKTVVLAGDGGAAQIGSLTFPIGLKPLHAHRFAQEFGIRKKLFLVEDEDAFAETYAEIAPLGFEFLATEIVPGGDDQLASAWTYLDESGEPLFVFTKRKIRQHPPRFGIGCYHLAEWLPDVAEVGLRFVRGIGLRGLAAVEFKRDPRDGVLKLIECNHRFTAATELVIASGLDLPLFVYNRQRGRPQPPLPTSYRRVTLWYPLEDLRSSLEYLRSGELSPGAWVRSVLRPQHFPLLSARDPAPALVSWWRSGRRVLRRLPSRAGRRAAG